MKRIAGICALCTILITAISLGADIPKLINYQGMLTDAGGTPIDGARNLTFRIYDDTTGGGALQWSEIQSGVQVDQGLFNVVLGKSTALSLAFDKSYWLEVEVEGEVMPRIRLTSVGYAYRAMVADSASTVTPGSGSNWSVSNSVLYTNEYWGIARGGAGNVLYGDSASTVVNFGVVCTTGTSGYDAGYLTVSGGYGNSAGWWYATVGGGWNNSAGGYIATVGGGSLNSASDSWATVGGGCNNKVSGAYATVGGGVGNTASQAQATVAGGFGNTSSGIRATVGGGFQNYAIGEYSMVPGGIWNTASGDGSFAAGWRAKALHAGSFVWADTNDVDFASTGPNQFLIRASGGVGIGTTSPARELHIVGDNPRILIEATSISPEVNFKNSGDPLSTVWALYKDGGTDDFKFYQNGDKVTIRNGTGNVGIGTTDPTEKLDVNGTARLRGIPAGSATPVHVDGDGKLWKESSSIRYKQSIRKLNGDSEKVLELRPVHFQWKATQQEGVGLIAEDVEQAIPDLVVYDEEGRPDAVKYDKVALYLLELVKVQQERISALEQEVAKLKR